MSECFGFETFPPAELVVQDAFYDGGAAADIVLIEHEVPASAACSIDFGLIERVPYGDVGLDEGPDALAASLGAPHTQSV